MYGNCGKDLLGKYRSCKDRWRSEHLGSFTPISTRKKVFKVSCLVSFFPPFASVLIPFLSVRDAQCGKIQCLSSASKPIENNAVRIETLVSVGNKKILCMGTHVYKAGQVDEDAQGDTLDPGLVMTGTKCGVDSVRLCDIAVSVSLWWRHLWDVIVSFSVS